MNCLSIFKYIIIAFSFSFITLILAACNKEEVEKKRVITTMDLAISYDTSSFFYDSFRGSDLDGVGGLDPVVDTITIEKDNIFKCWTFLKDQSNGNDISLTANIQLEGKEYIVCYEVSNGLQLAMEYTDQDSNGKPLGLLTTWTTSEVSQGSLKVTLKHFPQKSAPDACSTGETDLEFIYPVIIF